MHRMTLPDVGLTRESTMNLPLLNRASPFCVPTQRFPLRSSARDQIPLDGSPSRVVYVTSLWFFNRLRPPLSEPIHRLRSFASYTGWLVSSNSPASFA